MVHHSLLTHLSQVCSNILLGPVCCSNRTQEQVFLQDDTGLCKMSTCAIHHVKEYLDLSIELLIPELFICVVALLFYSSFYFFSYGSTVGGSLNALELMEGFQVSRERKKEPWRDVNNRLEWIKEGGKESREENEGDLKGGKCTERKRNG